MLLSVIQPRLYLPIVVIVWGIVSGASGFVQNYGGIVAVRFLTGVTEAPYFPGVIFFLSCWYKRSELPSRIAIFYSGYTLSSACGGLIAAGIIGNMDGVGGYPAWRWLFIIEGAATVVCAFPAFYLLPNYPATTSWLSEEERALAVYRLALEADGEEDQVQGSVFKGFKQCMIDPKVWLLVLIQSCATVRFLGIYHPPCLYHLQITDNSIDRNVIHLLLPFNRPDTGLPTDRDSTLDGTSIYRSVDPHSTTTPFPHSFPSPN